MSIGSHGGAVNHGCDVSYSGFVTKQVSITTSATEIVTGVNNRSKVVMVNMSTNVDIFISNSTSVSTTNGFLLPPRTPCEFPYFGSLYGITGSGSASLSIAELME